MKKTILDILDEIYEDAYHDGRFDRGFNNQKAVMDKYKQRIKEALEDKFAEAYNTGDEDCRRDLNRNFKDFFENLQL